MRFSQNPWVQLKLIDLVNRTTTGITYFQVSLKKKSLPVFTPAGFEKTFPIRLETQTSSKLNRTRFTSIGKSTKCGSLLIYRAIRITNNVVQISINGRKLRRVE